MSPTGENGLGMQSTYKSSNKEILGLSSSRHGDGPRVAAPAGPHIPRDDSATNTLGADGTTDEEGAVDIPRLHRRLQAYAVAYGLPAQAVRQMEELLTTPIAARLLGLPKTHLHQCLVIDAYKPKMHGMYDKYLSGVTADFALIVRRAPPPADPATLPSRQPALWAAFKASAASLSRTTAYGPYELHALRTQFGTELPKSLLERCHREGVATLEWQPRHQLAERADGKAGEQVAAEADGPGEVAVASGPLVSASLMETALMQRFQELAVEAQAMELRGIRGGAAAADIRAAAASPHPPPASFQPQPTPPCPACAPHQGQLRDPQVPPLPFDRTERLANSLARLVHTVERINGLRHGCRIALFAGRRASDLLYLLLQNLYCAAHLDGYHGTSSLYVVATLGREWTSMGVPERERWGGVGRLVGTHAHEQVSALQQLLAPYDVEAGRRCGLPHAVAVTPLLAHLLFFAANGGGGADGTGATALADTFTTAAFLAVSRAAVVPSAFRHDVEAAFGWHIPGHARCFDLFRVWRLDSGDYEQVAKQVVAVWKARCTELQAQGHPSLPRPELMNSNLSSVEEIAAVTSLEPEIKPTTLAFGTLADGFFPFLDPKEEKDDATAAAATSTAAATVADRPSMTLASVVMKLVQARPPRPLPPLIGSPSSESPPLPACAIKVGDGNSGKVQVDPRLEPNVAAKALQTAVEMARGSATSVLDSDAVSAVLADAYDAVTRRGVLLAVPPPTVG